MELDGIIAQAIIGLVVTLVTYVTHIGTSFIKEKTKNEKLKSAIDIVDSIIVAAVKNTEQAIKPDIISKAEDGKLSKGDKKMLLERTLDEIKSNVSKGVMDQVGSVIPDFGKYAKSKIEATLHDVKSGG